MKIIAFSVLFQFFLNRPRILLFGEKRENFIPKIWIAVLEFLLDKKNALSFSHILFYHSIDFFPIRIPILHLLAIWFYFLINKALWKSFLEKFSPDFCSSFLEMKICPHPHINHEFFIIAEFLQETFRIRKILFCQIFSDFSSRWSIAGNIVCNPYLYIHTTIILLESKKQRKKEKIFWQIKIIVID